MDIREFLNLHSSRLNADILADKIEEDPYIFDSVWDIMLEEVHPVSMRAAWSISIFLKRHPYFIESRIPEIISILPDIESPSVKRFLLIFLTLLPVPDNLSGFLFDFCFNLVESASAYIAHKAYAMTILYNISDIEPDLKPELIDLFESQMVDESTAIQSCSRKLLTRLQKDLSGN